jgi:hypothetical protein
MFVTIERLVWVECVRSRFFRGSLQFAPGFCLSPSSASPSCCSRHHCSVLCSFLPLNSHHNSGAAVTRSCRPQLFEQRRNSEVSRALLSKTRPSKTSALAVPIRAGFSAIGRPVQMHGEGSLRLNRKIDLLVRRTQSTQVLRVECAEGCRDGWPDTYDALLYSGPKQCNPKIAAKEQLRAAHCGRAHGMGRAINLHLLDRFPCIVHGAALTGGVTIFVHPRL